MLLSTMASDLLLRWRRHIRVRARLLAQALRDADAFGDGPVRLTFHLPSMREIDLEADYAAQLGGDGMAPARP